MAKTKKNSQKIQSLTEKFGGTLVFNTSQKKFNYLEEAGKSEIDYDITAKYLGNSVGEPHPYDFGLYEAAYKQVPIVFGALNKTVDFALGPGFYIDSKNKAVVKKLNDFMEEQDFDILLRIIVRNMLIYGNAYVEIVGNGKKIDKLIPLDPKYMFVKRDIHGNVEGYSQYRGKNKPIPFTPEEIAHFSYNQIGDQIYGTSILRPLFGSKKVSLLTQFLEMEDAMKTIVKRRANAPIHAKLGSDAFPATSDDVSGASNELVDLGNKNEIVTSHLVSLDTLNFKSVLMDIEPYIEHYENSIIYGLEVPAVLLGRANVPEGLANVQMDMFERRVKSLQSFIEQTLEEKVFKRLYPNDAIEFAWGQPTSELESAETERYLNILKMSVSNETKHEVENLLRKKLGLKELDEMTYQSDIDAIGSSIENKDAIEKKALEKKDKEKKNVPKPKGNA